MRLVIFSRQGTRDLILDKSEAFALNLSVKDFSLNVAKSNTNFYSQGGSIDYIQNQKNLQAIVDRNTTKPEGIIGLSCRAWIIADYGAFLGSIRFTGTETNNGRAQVNFNFIGTGADWIKDLPEYLYNLNMGECLFRFGETTIAEADYDPYDASKPCWFSYKWYNRWIEDAELSIEDLRPDLYVKLIIDSMEAATELNWQSQIFGSDWFGHWLMPYVGKLLFIRATRLYLAPAIAMTGALATNLWSEQWDTSGFHDDINGLFLSGLTGSNENGLVMVEFEFNWDVTTINTENSRILILDNDLLTVVGESDTILELGDNHIVIRTFVPPESRLVVYVDGSVDITTASEILYRVDIENTFIHDEMYIMNMSMIRRDLTTVDFISALTEMMNLVWYHDGQTKKLIIEPKWATELPTGEKLSGFYKSSTFAKNWSQFLDCGNSSVQDISAQYRRIKWLFKEDKDDVYTPDPEIYSEYIDVKDVGQLKEYKNKVFAPTVNQPLHDDYCSTDWVPIPHMGLVYDGHLVSGEEPFHDFQQRLLFKMGTLKTGPFHEANLPTKVLLAAQQLHIHDASLIEDMHDYAKIANLTYEDFKGVKGFVSLFYLNDVFIWRHGGRRKVTLNLPLAYLTNIENLLRNKQRIRLPQLGQGTHVIESVRLFLNKPSTVQLTLIDLALEQASEFK